MHTLDRFPDPAGNYEPGNVRWATPMQQGERRRNSVIITFNEKTQTASQWARELGINASALINRIQKYGWPIERAMTTPVGPAHRRAK